MLILLKNLEAAEAEENRLWELLEAAIDRGEDAESLEREWDSAYKVEFVIFVSLAEEISRMSGISPASAREIIRLKRDNLRSLLQKWEVATA